MAIICKLINATSGGVLNKDSDVQAMATALLNQGVINDTDTGNLAVTAGQVASGKCFIEVTRTNTSPNEKWLLYVWNQQDEAKTLGSNKFIYIEIPQNNINDNTLNTNPTGSGIANIVVGTAWPASNYIPLATTDGNGNITDVRTFIKLKTGIIDKLTGNTWKMFYSDGAGKIQEITIGSSTQVLTSNGTSSAPTFQSISIDITALTEKTTIQEDDLFVMYSASNTANRKIKATNALKSTKEIFVAGEDITAGNALYILPADGKAYKTDASNSSKINFIGFATNTVSTGGNVIVDTSGVSNTQSGLTAGNDYFLQTALQDDIQQLTQNVGNSCGPSTTRKIGQTLTITGGGFLKSAIFKFDKNSSTGDLTMAIYSGTPSSGTNYGGGNLLYSTILSNASIPTAYGTYTFSNINLNLPSGTCYVLFTNSAVSGNDVLIGANTAGGYAGGNTFYVIGTNVSNQTDDSYMNLDFEVFQAGAISTTPGTNVRRIGRSVSTTAIELETSANNNLEGTLGTTATTGSVTLGNAVGYVTVKINGVDRKIPYYS